MSDELEELAKRLEAAAGDGSNDAAELRDAVDAYRTGDEPTPEDHESLVERMNEATMRFETSHPELAGFLARVIDSLTAAGI